jgi:D-glycero-D-manno-heptose 1,7-bisphosphate phosphatase
VDCAHAAGCRAVFIDHGYSEPLREEPEFTVTTFREAVAVVLRNQLSHSTRRD